MTPNEHGVYQPTEMSALVEWIYAWGAGHGVVFHQEGLAA